MKISDLSYVMDAISQNAEPDIEDDFDIYIEGDLGEMDIPSNKLWLYSKSR